MNIAVFPGSFDPITVGHVDIINRAVPLFKKIIIGIGDNIQKQYMFPIEKRLDWIKKAFAGNLKIEVLTYDGLTINFCKQNNASYIIRGLRNSNDFVFEQSIAQMNKAMANGIETVFIPCDSRYTAVASTIVRDIIRNKGDASLFIPPSVKI
jgi:pantetheine-phosphate adenylyltransferase